VTRGIFPPELPSERWFDVVGLGANAADHLAVIPRYPRADEKVRFSRYSYQGGGQTATAMVVYARLGFSACYLGGVGDDADGRANVEALRSEGVNVSGVRVRPEGLTQRAFILVDESTGARTIVWGRSDGLVLDPDEVDPDVVRSAKLLHTDAQNPIASARAATFARDAGMPVLADLEKARPGIDVLLPLVDYVLAAPEFLEPMTGTSDPAKAMPILEEKSNGGIVVVTQGDRGAVAWIDGRVKPFPAYSIDAVDTTGAGDVFHAAFGVACLRGLDLPDAIDFSNAVAAMKCRELGGRAGIPNGMDEVEAFRKETPHREE